MVWTPPVGLYVRTQVSRTSCCSTQTPQTDFAAVVKASDSDILLLLSTYVSGKPQKMFGCNFAGICGVHV